MLVIDIPAGRSFHIGQNIEVRVLQRHGNRLKLGIIAPSDVPVLRDSLFQQETKRSDDHGSR